MKQHFCISNKFKMQLVVFELIQTDRQIDVVMLIVHVATLE